MKTSRRIHLGLLVSAAGFTAIALTSAIAAGAATQEPQPVATVASETMAVDALVQRELARTTDANLVPLDAAARAAVKVDTKLVTEVEAERILGFENNPNIPDANSDRLVWVISVDAHTGYDSVPLGYSTVANGFTDIFDASTGKYIDGVTGGGLLF